MEGLGCQFRILADHCGQILEVSRWIVDDSEEVTHVLRQNGNLLHGPLDEPIHDSLSQAACCARGPKANRSTITTHVMVDYRMNEMSIFVKVLLDLHRVSDFVVGIIICKIFAFHE
jgi:hypothetical protein